MSSTMTYKEGVYTVTLFREKEVVYELDGYFLLAVPESTASHYREKVLGPSYDGMLYMFYKGPGDPDYVWLSKEEYDSLLLIYNDIHPPYEYDDDSDGLDEECDYCHGAVGSCGRRCRDRD